MVGSAERSHKESSEASVASAASVAEEAESEGQALQAGTAMEESAVEKSEAEL